MYSILLFPENKVNNISKLKTPGDVLNLIFIISLSLTYLSLSIFSPHLLFNTLLIFNDMRVKPVLLVIVISRSGAAITAVLPSYQPLKQLAPRNSF